MGLFNLFRRDTGRQDAAYGLYNAIVRQARRPGFYLAWGVPDTVDGRFDMIAIHAHLVLRRLRRDHAATKDLAQALFDLMFADMDVNLRELGVGDMGMAKRIRKMAEGFFGRIAAYDRGLDEDPAGLRDSLHRNLFKAVESTDDQAERVADYMRATDALLAAQALDDLTAGRVAFPDAPPAPESPS